MKNGIFIELCLIRPCITKIHEKVLYVQIYDQVKNDNHNVVFVRDSTLFEVLDKIIVGTNKKSHLF